MRRKVLAPIIAGVVLLGGASCGMPPKGEESASGVSMDMPSQPSSNAAAPPLAATELTGYFLGGDFAEIIQASYLEQNNQVYLLVGAVNVQSLCRTIWLPTIQRSCS